jgi:hypothetical protein
MTPRATSTQLTAAQADGLACVECGADFLRSRVPHVPVGRSQTGSQIFACSSHGRQS